MKKLGALVVMGGALAAGLPGPASAATLTVTLQCTTFFGSPATQQVFGAEGSTGVTLPASCAPGGSCSQCLNDVRTSAGTFFVLSVGNVTQAITGYAGPYYVLLQF
jgi:hypothetical protein